MRVLRNTPATLEAKFYPSGSETLTNDAPVTVAVTRADGTAVAGVGAVTNPSTGVYQATLPAQANVGLLTATWSGATQTAVTEAEVVGGFYVTLAEIRAQKNLSSTSKFTTAELEDAREWFETLAEDHCGCGFVPRFARLTLDGTGCSRLRLGEPRQSLSGRRPFPLRRVLAATIDGAVATVTNWDVYPGGVVDTQDAASTFTLGRRNIILDVEYGYDRPPRDLRVAALTAIRSRLLTDEAGLVADRATSITNEFGNVLLSQPGTARPTGIPDVDAVLNRLNETEVPVA